MFVYKQSEFGLYPLWTVGFYEPGTNKWIPESDWLNKEEAADRVSYLNGNSKS